MDSFFSDDGPSVSSYTCLTYPEAGQQSIGVRILDKRETYHPTAALGVDGPGDLPDSCIHMTPPLSHQTMDEQAWPSPPLGPGDIHNCVLPFPDLPACAGINLSYYRHSPVSPTTWSSSPTSSFLHLHDPYPSQPAMDSPASYIHMGTPTSCQDYSLSGSEVGTTPYTGGFYQDSDGEAPMMVDPLKPMLASPTTMAASLPAVPTSCSSAGSADELCVASPASVDTTMMTPSTTMRRRRRRREEAVGKRGDGAVGSVVGASRSAGLAARSYTFANPGDMDMLDAKNEEPYAKLIYRAFMSRPDHCMALQDIYQWFRDNTNKASDEKGGWQNSIRHNLSMNAAFTRREQKQVDGTRPGSSAGGAGTTKGTEKETSTANAEGGAEAKRTNEWVLEDWAVRDGVQSTTRYRKGSLHRRMAARYTSHPGSVGMSMMNMGMSGGGNGNNKMSKMNGLNNNINRSIKNMNKMSSNNNDIHDQHHGSIRPLSALKSVKSTSRMRRGAGGEVGEGGQRCSSLGSPVQRCSSHYAILMHDAHHYQDHQMQQGCASPSGSASIVDLNSPLPYFSAVIPLSPIGQMQREDDDCNICSDDDKGMAMKGDAGLSQTLEGGVLPYFVSQQQEAMYLTPSPVEFPYGISDVHLSYSGEPHGAEVAESGRFLGSLHDDRVGHAGSNDNHPHQVHHHHHHQHQHQYQHHRHHHGI